MAFSADDLILYGANKMADEVLQKQINSLESIGRFLALWDCSTGLPLTDPVTGTPYTYKTGDYYRVGAIGSTNYKPNGSAYTKTASTVAESKEVAIGSVYYYDGDSWELQPLSSNEVSFTQTLTSGTEIGEISVGTNKKKIYAPTAITKTSQLTNDSNYIQKSTLDTELAKKQAVLTAGENITISDDNVISASGGGSGATNVLTGIEITSQPTKTTYTEGETFDITGMVLTATYNVTVEGIVIGTKTENVTGYTYSPTRALTITDTEITVTYSYGDVTKTATVAITVKEKIGVCAWSTGSWEKISQALDAHYAGDIDLADYWSVGDERTMENGDVWTILGFNHDDLADGSGKAAVTIWNISRATGSYPNTKYSTAVDYTVNYSNSVLRTVVSDTKSWLDSDAQSLVKTVTKVSAGYDESGTESTVSTEDEMFALSCWEIFGASVTKTAFTIPKNKDGNKYEYFNSYSTRTYSWPFAWARSVGEAWSVSAVYIDGDSGAGNVETVTTANPVAVPACCL